MRKLLLKLAFLFIPILSALVLVNYNIDPGGKYSKQNFYKLVADELAKGKNIFITEKFHNYLGSKLIMNLIQNQRKSNHTTLIGSSMIMPITAEMIGEKSFMNYGIHGARLGDLIGMYELLREKENLPKRLIIELSPLIFMNAYQSKHEFNAALQNFISRTQGKQETSKGKNLLSKSKEAFNHYAELFSPKYFQQSLKFYFKDESQKDAIHKEFKYADEATKNDPQVISYDNSRFKGIDNNKNAASKIFKAKSNITNDIFGTTLDVNKNTNQLFIQWLQDIIKNDIEVVLLVLPFNPYFYDEEIKTFADNNILSKTDQHIKNINSEFGNIFKVIGTTNPRDWGITDEDALTYYFDFAHTTSYGMTQLFSKIDYFNRKKS